MFSFTPNFSPVILNNHISVKTAARYSGYSLQYLRRLLRSSKLLCIKVGQLWLIDKGSFDTYLENIKVTSDERFGPK